MGDSGQAVWQMFYCVHKLQLALAPAGINVRRRQRTRHVTPGYACVRAQGVSGQYDELPLLCCLVWWVNKTSIGLLMFALDADRQQRQHWQPPAESPPPPSPFRLATRAPKWRPKQMATSNRVPWDSHACV